MGFVAWSVQNDSGIHVLFKLSAVTAETLFICMAVSAVKAVKFLVLTPTSVYIVLVKT